MELSNADKELLKQWGYTERDYPQIEEAMQKSKTKYWLDSKPIAREKAVFLLGRAKYLSGIARSAFHWSAARETETGEIVYFDSSKLFAQ